MFGMWGAGTGDSGACIFCPSPAEDSRRLTQVGALPHRTQLSAYITFESFPITPCPLSADLNSSGRCTLTAVQTNTGFTAAMPASGGQYQRYAMVSVSC